MEQLLPARSRAVADTFPSCQTCEDIEKCTAETRVPKPAPRTITPTDSRSDNVGFDESDDLIC